MTFWRADWEPRSPAGYILTVLLLCAAVYGSLLLVFTFGG